MGQKAKKDHPDFERWQRLGFPRGDLVRTTCEPNSHHIGPGKTVYLNRVGVDGYAHIYDCALSGVLAPGEWQWVKKEEA